MEPEDLAVESCPVFLPINRPCEVTSDEIENGKQNAAPCWGECVFSENQVIASPNIDSPNMALWVYI